MSFNGKKVLVTGAGGFIGSHLVERLFLEGCQVTAFLHYNSRGDIGLLKYAPQETLKNVRFYFGDLKDADSVEEAAKGQEIVFHLGALIGIPYSYRHPRDVVETNVMGTIHVLTAAMKNKVRRILHTSTSEVYGTAKFPKITEEHPLQGQSPYSASKIGADKIVESFAASYRLPVVTIRPFNTYGPRQSLRAVVPTIISQFLFQDEVCLGSLEPVRDFTFVEDTVEAFLMGASVEGIEGEVFNLGTDSEIAIGDVVRSVASLTGFTNKKVRTAEERVRPKASEVYRLRSDYSLAKQRLSWEPKISLKEGLKKTIEWIRHYPQDYSSAGYAV